MHDLTIIPVMPELESRFYTLAAEYLPGSDPDRMRRFAPLYPRAFLALLLDGQLIGAAYGWPRRFFAPDDPSFTLDGIVIACEHQRNGYGKQLLSAFESAAKAYGAPAVSVGSAGGCVEQFYIDCGYFPKEYKIWLDGVPRVAQTFSCMEEYRSFPRNCPDGFIVMEKAL